MDERAVGGRSIGRRSLFKGGLGAMAVFLAGCGGDDTPTGGGGGSTPGGGSTGGSASAGGGELTELYEAAKGEGSVTLYSHVTASEQIDAFVADFKAAYPGIEVNLTNKTGSAILETFLSEKRADRNDVDVIQYPGIAPFSHEFMDEKLIDKYTPTSADEFPADATVPDYAYPWLTYSMGAAYNTDLITDEELELLRTHKGWADPSWKGRIDCGSPGSASIQRALFQWVDKDPELGEEWFKSFAANEPVPFSSVTPAAERVIAGEFVATFPNMSITAARAIPEGAPIGWATQEYTVTNPALVALASKAPHPNAAKLLIEYHLSKQGQQAMISAVAADSLRDDLKDVAPVESDNFDTPKELVVVDEDEFAERGQAVIDLWNSTIGPGAG